MVRLSEERRLEILKCYLENGEKKAIEMYGEEVRAAFSHTLYHLETVQPAKPKKRLEKGTGKRKMKEILKFYEANGVSKTMFKYDYTTRKKLYSDISYFRNVLGLTKKCEGKIIGRTLEEAQEILDFNASNSDEIACKKYGFVNRIQFRNFKQYAKNKLGIEKRKPNRRYTPSEKMEFVKYCEANGIAKTAERYGIQENSVRATYSRRRKRFGGKIISEIGNNPSEQ